MLRNVFIISLLIYAASCRVTPQDAASYNNRIIALDSVVTSDLDNLISAVDSLETDDYNALYLEFIEKLQTSVNKLDSISSFYGDNELYLAAKYLFLNYYNISENELKHLREIVEMPDSAYNSDADSAWQYLSYQLNKQLQINVDSFLQVQKEFIERYDLSFEKE